MDKAMTKTECGSFSEVKQERREGVFRSFGQFDGQFGGCGRHSSLRVTTLTQHVLTRTHSVWSQSRSLRLTYDLLAPANL